MKTPSIALLTLTTLVLPLLASAAGAGAPGRRVTPVLSTEAREALIEALAGPEGEYAARATYEAILAKFGAVAPYANILQAEERHIAALQRQLSRYGVPIPDDVHRGQVQAPASLKDAAAAGVAAEEQNVAMFDALLVRVAAYPDLSRVFAQLQRVSREHHLPAFQAAVAGTGTCPGAGPSEARGQRVGRGAGCRTGLEAGAACEGTVGRPGQRNRGQGAGGAGCGACVGWAREH